MSNLSASTGTRCCLILVFLGEWPAWFPYFLTSCAANNRYHWHIFSDSGIELPSPRNVIIHYLSRSSLDELISRKLGCAYQLSSGYKLCDLKPAYGHLFEEFIRDYEFWGYTDLDLIYGDLSIFISDEILDSFDVITASHRILVGHFTLVRNSVKLVRLYRECPDFMEKFRREDYAVFDEGDFANLIYSLAGQGKIRLFQKSFQTDDCIIWWSGRSRFIIVWNRGKLYDIFAVRPLGYFHFIQRKHSPAFQIDPVRDDLYRFYIDMAGIHHLTRAGDYFPFVLSALIAFAVTLPWYFKTILKWILPGNVRKRLRKMRSN